ncbi:MAG TPA: 2OG-Fe(II) oxygenase [Dongiaceae bacterium]|nr:2OG-Fe(II) oxygenase [Dongiaceae bacterium]
MSMFDFEAFERAPLHRDPCDFILVPGFVKPDALEAINRDYPAITEPGNFPPEGLVYGAGFKAMLDELHTPEVKQRFAAKFDMDLSECPLQLTVRKYSEASDGNIHNDSKSKRLTVLIYFNKEWHAPGGQLRLVRDPNNMDDYFVEVPPVNGTLLSFRRNEHSFHGFPAYVGERRSIQFYWVKPKRAERESKRTGLGIWLKRLRKIRPR